MQYQSLWAGFIVIYYIISSQYISECSKSPLGENNAELNSKPRNKHILNELISDFRLLGYSFPVFINPFILTAWRQQNQFLAPLLSSISQPQDPSFYFPPWFLMQFLSFPLASPAVVTVHLGMPQVSKGLLSFWLCSAVTAFPSSLPGKSFHEAASEVAESDHPLSDKRRGEKDWFNSQSHCLPLCCRYA